MKTHHNLPPFFRIQGVATAQNFQIVIPVLLNALKGFTAGRPQMKGLSALPHGIGIAEPSPR